MDIHHILTHLVCAGLSDETLGTTISVSFLRISLIYKENIPYVSTNVIAEDTHKYKANYAPANNKIHNINAGNFRKNLIRS